jgi:hypothetical protein
MNGYTTLADRVASLLPNTTAGACVPASPWVSKRGPVSSGHIICVSERTCHYSCHGGAICGPWIYKSTC